MNFIVQKATHQTCLAAAKRGLKSMTHEHFELLVNLKTWHRFCECLNQCLGTTQNANASISPAAAGEEPSNVPLL